MILYLSGCTVQQAVAPPKGLKAGDGEEVLPAIRLGDHLNVVLKNGRTVSGRVTTVTAEKLVLGDGLSQSEYVVLAGDIASVTRPKSSFGKGALATAVVAGCVFVYALSSVETIGGP